MHVACGILKTVMCSAAEAEQHTRFVLGSERRQDTTYTLYWLKVGHMQRLAPVHYENSIAIEIKNSPVKNKVTLNGSETF